MIELLLQAERALSMGMVDQAERLYRQAADADPRNSIAVVGLARVALERADDAEAWRQANRALDIDPENAAARRLVDRLEEVWHHRGGPPPWIEPAAEPAAELAAVTAVPSPVERQPVTAPVAVAAPSAPEASPADGSMVGEPSAEPVVAAPAPHSPTRSSTPSTTSSRRLVDRLLRRNRA